MKLYIVAALMGEGPVYVFSSLAAANLFADKEDGALFEGGVVVGNPSKVWVVFFGDRGCTSGFSGIFLDEATAKTAAQVVEKDDSEGYSFWVSEEAILSSPPTPKATEEIKGLARASLLATTGTPAQLQNATALAVAAISQQLKK